MSEPGSTSSGFHWTGSRPAGFQETVGVLCWFLKMIHNDTQWYTMIHNDTQLPKPAHSQHISECHSLQNQRMMTGNTFSLQHTATHCNTFSLQHTATHCNTFSKISAFPMHQFSRTCCSVLQCVAVCCSEKMFPVIKPWLQLFSSYLWHRCIHTCQMTYMHTWHTCIYMCTHDVYV